MTADRTPPLLPIVTGVGEYCAPRDAAPRWMLVFDDADAINNDTRREL